MVGGPVTLAVIVALLAEAALLAALIVSIVWPERRLWPPGDRSAGFWFIWGAAGVAFAAVVVVVYQTAGGFVFDTVSWRLVGAGLTAVGVSIWGLAAYTLRPGESAGLSGELCTSGLYRITRNPQNMAMFAAVAGVTILVNSLEALIVALPAFLWLSLSPYAEEPWLRGQYGEAYEQYCREVPRFVRWRSVKRLTGAEQPVSG